MVGSDKFKNPYSDFNTVSLDFTKLVITQTDGDEDSDVDKTVDEDSAQAEGSDTPLEKKFVKVRVFD